MHLPFLQSRHERPPSSDIESLARQDNRSVSAAKHLVTFVFSLNVCFAVYLVTQFFAPKPYSNELHAVYTLIVLATTALLGLSTRRLWGGEAKQGAYLFFNAIAVSFVGNIVSELLA